MAKHLQSEPPSSSVAKLFDLNAAARAVGPHGAGAPTRHAPGPDSKTPPQDPAEPRGHVGMQRRSAIDREFSLTPGADATFSRLIATLRASTGTRMNASHVLRALLKAVQHRFDFVEHEVRRIGFLQLPANSPQYEHDRERFEAVIADALLRGMDSSACSQKGP